MYQKLVCVFIGALLTFSLSFHVNAKVRGEAHVTTITSKVLKESRELLIHLPNNYSRYKDTTYPVLYLLDGQRNFAHTVGTLAAAGMWSTPSDMLKMASSVRSAYLGQKTDWISQATAQEMLTNNTPSIEPPNVGIGFFINMDDNGEILGFGHGGADAGFMSQLYIELYTGNGYAIMTNGNNGMQLISELEIRLKEALDVGYLELKLKS